jgi:dienelactone hydrolase
MVGLLLVGAVALGQQPVDPKEQAKEFVQLLVKEDFAGAVKGFDAKMAGVMPADKVQAMWKSLLAQVGAFKEVKGVRTEDVAGHVAVMVACQFDKAVLDFRVVIDKEQKIAGLQIRPATSTEYKPPAYVRADAFRETEVTIGSGTTALPGTLSRPVRKGLVPAVVLVHGSGPHDRDESVGATKPFRDLAGGLASKNIVVLRYEKRTKVYGAQMQTEADCPTLQEETIDDALAAVALLKKTDGIDKQRIYVLGHSLGAFAAPKIASLDKGIAGIILLAGNSRPLEDLIIEQFTYLYSLEGPLTEEKKKHLETMKQQAARLKDPKLSPDTPAKELPLGLPAKYWLSFRDYRPAEVAKTLKQPMLILQGERDYQVTMEDFDGWKKALAGKKNATLKSYPDLNHLFMVGSGKSKPAEYMKAGNVSQLVVDDVAAWIGKK